MTHTIFDTHAHYDDPAFDNDRDELLSHTLPDAGICNIINCSADIAGCNSSIDLANKYDYVYAAVGVHPHELHNVDINELADLAAKPKVVAIGEIGLDYHVFDDNNPPDKAMQIAFFEAQLTLANKLDLPVIIHDREAHADTMELLRKYKPKGIVHCFSGSAQMARDIINLGMHIGIGGVVTFHNAKHATEVAKSIPLEYLVLETDAPYMAPVPFRGKRCDSSLISHTVEKIAEIRNVNPDSILHQTNLNARRLFKIH